MKLYERFGMGKREKWEHVAFEDIRIGDVIRRSVDLKDGTAKTLTGAIHYKGLVTASTENGFVLAREGEPSGIVKRRVVKARKPKLPVEPGTVIDAVVVRSWSVRGPAERRSIRLIRGRAARWVGMEHGSGWQFIAEDADIKKWTLVAAALGAE